MRCSPTEEQRFNIFITVAAFIFSILRENRFGVFYSIKQNNVMYSNS
jgi:hypothetical protein